MAKNTELFINLCNFMKYFLKEVLPEDEPSDQLKLSIKELIFTLINYSNHIKCDISPISLKQDRALDFTNILTVSFDGDVSNVQSPPETDRPGSHHGAVDESEVSSRESPVSRDSGERSDPCSGTYSSESRPTDAADMDKSSATSSSQPVSGDLQNHIPLPDQPEHSKSRTENHEAEDSGFDSPKILNVDNDVGCDLDILSECFIKTLFLGEHQTGKTPSTQNQEGKDVKKNFKKNISKPENSTSKVTQLTFPHRVMSLTTISPEFVEVSRCLLEKLVFRANYCWECGFCVKEVQYMQNHLEKHNADNPTSAFKVVKMCEECKFIAVLPEPLVDRYLQYHIIEHQQNSNLNGQNVANHIQLVRGIFIKKTSEESLLPNFIGTCLICNTFFNTPLEWSFHLFEFQHLTNPEEHLVTCSFCCIVILGSVQELQKNDYLNLPEHKSVCRGRLVSKVQRRY